MPQRAVGQQSVYCRRLAQVHIKKSSDYTLFLRSCVYRASSRCVSFRLRKRRRRTVCGTGRKPRKRARIASSRVVPTLRCQRAKTGRPTCLTGVLCLLRNFNFQRPRRLSLRRHLRLRLSDRSDLALRSLCTLSAFDDTISDTFPGRRLLRRRRR